MERMMYKQFFHQCFLEYSNSGLKSKFNQFNKEYFKNKLSTDKVQITSAPFQSSLVLGFYDTRDHSIYINKNRLPDEVIDLILLHEMIHAYNIQVDKLDPSKEDPHGPKFEKMRNAINKSLKYKIPKKEDMSSIEFVLDDLGIE